ncbi:rRNA-processing protein [Wolffia australiana]
MMYVLFRLIASREAERGREEESMKSSDRPRGSNAAAAQRAKNRQKLGGGGGGLSLISFANAKSKDTGYNPAIIKKQREFYKNAKIVKKYKKTVKEQTQHGEKHLPVELRNEIGQDEDNKPRKKKKKDARLQSLREEYEKKREEKEKAMREKEAAIEARKEERARAEASRKAQREKMLKRTRSGQPIMRYRIEHLLQGILNNPT